MKHGSLISQTWFIGLFMVVVAMVVCAESDSKTNLPNMNNKNLSKTKDNVVELEDFKKMQKMLQNGTKPITWVFVGDSITHGALHTHGWRSYPEHFAERVRWELKRYTDIVINTGVTNDTTNILLNTWDERVACFKPGVVSIMEGMNDSCDGAIDKEKFAKNLSEIIRKVRQIKAIPILHTMNTINPADLQRKNLPEYVEVIRAVAQKEKAILVDNYQCWDVNSNPRKWLNDNIHPNEVGHRAIADEMFRTLEIFDDKSPTCSLPLQK